VNEGRGEHGPWLNMVCWKVIFNGMDMDTLVSCIEADKQDPALKEIGASIFRVALECSNAVASLRTTGSEDILYWLESPDLNILVSRAFTVTKYATIEQYAKQWRNLILFCWRSFEMPEVNERFTFTDDQRGTLQALKNHLSGGRNSPPPTQGATDRLILNLSLSLIHQEGDLLPTTIKYFCGIMGWDRST
jgi:hypothetical protein